MDPMGIAMGESQTGYVMENPPSQMDDDWGQSPYDSGIHHRGTFPTQMLHGIFTYIILHLPYNFMAQM